SKALATLEGTIVDLSSMEPTREAQTWSERTGRSALFCEAVLRATVAMHGHVRGGVPGAMLTEVRPAGLPSGTILVANAGLDESNVPNGTAIGWPADPATSARQLR